MSSSRYVPRSLVNCHGATPFDVSAAGPKRDDAELRTSFATSSYSKQHVIAQERGLPCTHDWALSGAADVVEDMAPAARDARSTGRSVLSVPAGARLRL